MNFLQKKSFVDIIHRRLEVIGQDKSHMTIGQNKRYMLMICEWTTNSFRKNLTQKGDESPIVLLVVFSEDIGVLYTP